MTIRARVGFIDGFRFLRKNLILSWRIREFVKRIGEADGVFLVHMGVPEHKKELAPSWMLRIIRWLAPSSLIYVGEYPRGESGIRIITVSPVDLLDAFSQREFRGIIHNAIRIQKGIGAQKVILGGHLPHYTRQHYGQRIPDVLEMDNFRGPVFALTAAAQLKFEELSLQQERDWVCIVGVGFVGRALASRLLAKGFKVFGLDTGLREEAIRITENFVLTSDPELLSAYNIRLVIITTRLGSDIRETIPFLPQGVSLINEAYPGIFVFSDVMKQLAQKGILSEQLSLVNEGIRPSRALWGYEEDEIPPCMVRFLVDLVEPRESSIELKEGIHDRLERVATGSRLGLKPNLTRYQD